MKESKENEGYSIKQMERPKEFITTIHGLFRIREFDPNKGEARPQCYECFYKNRKVTGAPCTNGTWCGNLYSSLIPVRLTKEGKELERSGVVKTATKIAAR